MSRGQQIRPARLAALYVGWGDVLVTAPSDGARVIGTVLRENKTTHAEVSFTYRAPDGQVKETQPIAPEKPVWVHVPAGTA